MKSRKRKLRVSEESGHAGDSLSSAFKGVNMSKKPKNRNANKDQEAQKKAAHFELRHIKPLTPNQEKVFTSYQKGYHLMLHGFAGTGKTLIQDAYDRYTQLVLPENIFIITNISYMLNRILTFIWSKFFIHS